MAVRGCRWRPALRGALAIAAGLLLVAGCTASGQDTNGAGTVPAKPLTFYRPATVLASGKPGDILNMSPITIAPTYAGVGSRMTFVSTTPAGDLVPVTGVVITPTAPPPPEGYPIVVWAHGTVGLGDPCTPSRFEPFSAAGIEQFLASGYMVVAPDYEGLGVENETHPYLVGEASGNNVLDAARVGRSLGGGTKVAVFGWSQGGHATLFARELAPTYAPELDVVGVVAAAPVTNPATVLLRGRTDPNIFPYTANAILAWSEVYEEPKLDDLIAAADAEKVRLARDQSCTGDLVTDKPLDQIFLSDPQDLDVWRAVSDLNTPRADDIGTPVLVSHGDADTLVPIEGTVAYHDALCRAGEHVVFKRDPSWGHTAAWAVPLPDILSWIAARFAGAPPPTDCP